MRERTYSAPIGIRLCIAVMVTGAAAFAGFLLIAPGGQRPVVLIDDLFQGVVPLTLAIAWGVDVLLHRGRFGEARPIRRASLCLCLCGVCFALGQFIYTYDENVAHQSPFPSWADVPFLTAYLFLGVGTFSLATAPKALAQRIRMSMDGIICLTSLVIISWYFVLGPSLVQTSRSPLAQLIGTTYPFLDVVILSALLLLIMNSHSCQVRPAIATLLAGSLCIIVADTVYDYQNLHGSFTPGRCSTCSGRSGMD